MYGQLVKRSQEESCTVQPPQHHHLSFLVSWHSKTASKSLNSEVNFAQLGLALNCSF